MRRLLLSVLALSALGLTTGCKSARMHGVCDCTIDDPCATRAPWVQQPGPSPKLMPPAEGRMLAPVPVTPTKGL